jgi:Rrf2 family protein
MKISTRLRYGLRMMMDLGARGGTVPILLREIARDECISEKYLSQIIIPLKAHGLVATFRGAHGGYMLGRPATDIRIKEIVEALEGTIELVDCIESPATCARSGECVARELWEGLGGAMRGYLESVTLDELVRKLKVRRGEPAHQGSYSI